MTQRPNFEFVLDSLNSCVNSTLSSQQSNMSNVIDQRCRKCKIPATLSCMRCGDFYCSHICQDNDWNAHRTLCIVKPPLVNINEQIKIMPKNESINLQKQLRKLASACEEFANQLNNLDNNKAQILNGFDNGMLEQSKTQRSLGTIIKDDLFVMVCFGKLNSVFLCPKNSYDAYSDIIKQIDEYGEKAPTLKILPEINSFVISRRHGQFCRAKVLSVMEGNPENIRLVYVDYGNFSIRRLFELRQITPNIADLPIHVAAVKLKNVVNVIVTPCVWHSILNTFEKKTYIMKTHSYDEFELFDADTGDSLNKKIVDIIKNRSFNEESRYIRSSVQEEQSNIESLVSAVPKHSFNCPNSSFNIEEKKEEKLSFSPVMIAPFKTNIFSRTECNIEVVVIDAPLSEFGYMTCVPLKHFKEFTDIEAYIKQLSLAQDEPYVPQHGEYVLAEFEGEWYRGHVIDVKPDGDGFEISYDDYFNVETVSSSKIRRYPDGLTIDCNTQLCALSGLPKKITPELKMFLKNEINVSDKIFIDRIVDVNEKDVVLIECREIIDRMLKKNLV